MNDLTAIYALSVFFVVLKHKLLSCTNYTIIQKLPIAANEKLEQKFEKHIL